MISVSLCMIVKNEEDVLERCLKSVAGLVDEIIIVDTGSTDRTREIATHFTNQIFERKKSRIFVIAWNFVMFLRFNHSMFKTELFNFFLFLLQILQTAGGAWHKRCTRAGCGGSSRACLTTNFSAVVFS